MVRHFAPWFQAPQRQEHHTVYEFLESEAFRYLTGRYWRTRHLAVNAVDQSYEACFESVRIRVPGQRVRDFMQRRVLALRIGSPGV